MSSETVIAEALVNRKTGELVEVGVQKSPEEIMLDATEAAKALERLIVSNKRPPVIFNGKRYLEFPHWQTIGKFYHVGVETHDAIFLEVGGTRGFHAQATVIDEKSGLKIGGGEGYCMVDEPNWRSRPLFQLASMAQTRAACKALSNKFRYVAIVAGYEPAAAEEMVEEERIFKLPRERAIPPGPTGPEQEPEEPKQAAHGGDRPITDKQRSLLFAKSREAKIPEDMVKIFIREHFGLEHTSDLTRLQFDKVLNWLDGRA